MRPRSRALAALFALVALTFSFAEGVWASSCAPGMEMSAAPIESAADACMAEMAAHADEPGDPSPERPGAPHCPFAPLSMAGTCLVAASLPAPSPVDLALSAEGALLTPSLDQTRDLLLVSVLFHPPRA